VSQDERDSGIATITADYGYFNDEEMTKGGTQQCEPSLGPAACADPGPKDDKEKGHTPILVMKDRRSRALFADVTPVKGANAYAVKTVVQHVLWLGYNRVKLRSDGEPAIRALLDEAAVELKKKGVEVVPDKTPVGDSQAGGLQESSVNQEKNKCRAIWQQACELHQVSSSSNHRLLPWCVQYAAQLVTRTHKGDDGKTSWSIVTGRREFPRPLAPWGEKVMYIAGGGKFKPGVQPKWQEGIILGLVDTSNEYVIGTPEGCVKSSNIKRVPKEFARDPTLFNQVQGSPWKLSPTAESGLSQEDIPTRIAVRAQVASHELPGPIGRGADAGPRKVYIRRNVELEKYGRTDGCPGCLAAALDRTAVGHNDECRQRIEQEMSKDEAGQERLQAHRQNPEDVNMEAEGPQAGEPSGGPATDAAPAGPVQDQVMGQAPAGPAQGQDMGQDHHRKRESQDGDSGVTENKRLKGGDVQELLGCFHIPVANEDEEYLSVVCDKKQNRETNKLNPGVLIDLRSWDLADSRHVEAAWRYIKVAKPYLVVGNFKTHGARELCNMYKWQHSHGSRFVHEGEQDEAYGLGFLASVRQRKGICAGVATDGASFVTNSPTISRNLKRMAGPLASEPSGAPATAADQVKARSHMVMKGLTQELEHQGRLHAMDGGGPTVEERSPEEEWQEWEEEHSRKRQTQGDGKRYYDEVTGKELDPKLVQEARTLEVEYMHRFKVYEEATMEDCINDGCQPIPMRFVDLNKGDEENINIRSRAVLQETRKRSNLGKNDIAATFAATPPLEGLRLLISMSMTGQQGVPRNKRRVLGFYDVSRAHWHSPAKRKMYVKTLPEDPSIKTGIARLLKAMYGGRDAGNCWDDFSEVAMKKLGHEPGIFCPCVYHSQKYDATCWRHGDDFVLLATRDEHKRFLKEANKLMILKEMGVLGPSKELGDVQEVRCMNRILRYVQPAFKGDDAGYIEWEADPRHLEILMASLGVKEDSKPLGQPCAKMDKAADTTPLDAEAVTNYRSNVMRLSYLAQDRADVQFASKELARSMQGPTQWDQQQLKRAVRYLKGAGRVVQRFHQQGVPKRLTVFTDSDFAGCVRTRKSTSCCMVFWGQHLLKSTSTTQAVISLSSGEAEFYSAVKGGSVGLGIVALMRDMGLKHEGPFLLRVDSTACLGMAGRKGAGRVRHIHTPCLWLQKAVADGRIELEKVEGTLNPADLGTKALPQASIQRILAQCGYVGLQGRSKMALKAAV